MRILIVSYGYSCNDVSESLTAYKISKELEKHCEIKILTKDQSDLSNVKTIKTTQFFKNSSYYRSLKPDYPEFIFKAYRFAKLHQEEFDIIHHISPISLRYPNPLCNLNRPFIWGPVGGSIPYPDGFKKIQCRETPIEKLRNIDSFRLRYDPLLINTMKNSNKIIVSCNAVLNNIPNKYKKKVIIIPEGIDACTISTNKISEGNYIFSSGRMVPYKGFELLINAFTHSKLSRDISLIITGEGKDKERLYCLINNLGMGSKIKLLGKISKKENILFMKNSLFCVFPALNEAFGHVNLEAMSMGKPIIVTNNGGPADIVIDGKTGFKIHSNSIKGYISELTGRLNILYSNINLRNEMGLIASQRIKDVYSWKTIGKKYIKIYKNIMEMPFELRKNKYRSSP